MNSAIVKLAGLIWATLAILGNVGLAANSTLVMPSGEIFIIKTPIREGMTVGLGGNPVSFYLERCEVFYDDARTKCQESAKVEKYLTYTDFETALTSNVYAKSILAKAKQAHINTDVMVEKLITQLVLGNTENKVYQKVTPAPSKWHYQLLTALVQSVLDQERKLGKKWGKGYTTSRLFETNIHGMFHWNSKAIDKWNASVVMRQKFDSYKSFREYHNNIATLKGYVVGSGTLDGRCQFGQYIDSRTCVVSYKCGYWTADRFIVFWSYDGFTKRSFENVNALINSSNLSMDKRGGNMMPMTCSMTERGFYRN